MSAKKDETKRKRLATLIEDSANGRTIKILTRSDKTRSSEGGEDGGTQD